MARSTKGRGNSDLISSEARAHSRHQGRKLDLDLFVGAFVRSIPSFAPPHHPALRDSPRIRITRSSPLHKIKCELSVSRPQSVLRRVCQGSNLGRPQAHRRVSRPTSNPWNVKGKTLETGQRPRPGDRDQHPDPAIPD